MPGSIRKMSSEMGDNHGKIDLLRWDSSVRIKTRKCAGHIKQNMCGTRLKYSQD